MGNWNEYRLDVFARKESEIDQIATRLQCPSQGLLDWAAEKLGAEGAEAIARISKLCEFKPEKGLNVDNWGVQASRRFNNSFQRYTGIVNSHLDEVSIEFPSSLFLLTDWDCQFNYSRKRVIRTGKVVQKIFDDHKHSHAQDWALPDIFIPFKSEWARHAEFGSLWNEWLDDNAAVIESLRKAAAEK